MPLDFDNKVRQFPIMEIGDRIRTARRRLNLTQGQLAKMVGVEQSTVSGWETDPVRRPSRDLVPALAKALKVTIHHLEFGGAADEGRQWGEPRIRDQAVENGAAIDPALMAEVIKMAMRSLITPYGVDIPAKRYEQAAETAADAYLAYIRLQSEGDAA